MILGKQKRVGRKMRELQIKNCIIGAGSPKICVSITEETEEAILERAALLKEQPADLIEWRADAFLKLKDEGALKAILAKLREVLADKPLIFTIRTKVEGGLVAIEDSVYLNLIHGVIESKLVDLIDVEVRVGDERIREILSAAGRSNVYVIGSKHDFEKTDTLENLLEVLEHIENSGVDIVKTAYMPHSKTDVLNLMLATQLRQNVEGTAPLVTMSMGKLGTISRLTGEFTGSAITFGAFGDASAPGQIEIQTLKKALDLLALIEI